MQLVYNTAQIMNSMRQEWSINGKNAVIVS